MHHIIINSLSQIIGLKQSFRQVTWWGQSYLHASYSGGSICVSGLLVTDCSHSPQATHTEPSPCYLSWWKYLWEWLVGLRQSQTAATELLVLVEVSIKVACRSTDCSTELLILVEVSVKVACRSTQSQTAATEPSPCNLLWWKYLWKWLVGPRQSQTEGTEPSPCYLF